MLNHTFFEDKVVKKRNWLHWAEKYGLNLRRRLRKRAKKKTKKQQIT